jgi:hypothetical protein
MELPLKKQVKRIRILINEKQLTSDLTALFFSGRFTERGETFQVFRSSHRFLRLSDAAILVWLKE